MHPLLCCRAASFSTTFEGWLTLSYSIHSDSEDGAEVPDLEEISINIC
jgi:hypothetical protein